MLSVGVNIAIIQDDKILLTRREDFEVWCLPGGAVDEGESVAQAAVREAHEETGLEVELTRLIGVYSRPGWPGAGMHIISFAAQVVGGALNPDPHEVIEVGYFSLDELPPDMLWWHHRRISDALNGVGGGVAWTQDVDYPFERKLSRQEIYQMRDQSGLTRSQFYFETLGNLQGSREVQEIKFPVSPGSDEREF